MVAGFGRQDQKSEDQRKLDPEDPASAFQQLTRIITYKPTILALVETIHLPLSYPRVLINPDLHPETSDTYELGLDARFIEGRLGLDVTLYRIRDFNNLYSLQISEGTGYTSNLVNSNEFIRKGIENYAHSNAC
jgi:hypothetical protein